KGKPDQDRCSGAQPEHWSDGRTLGKRGRARCVGFSYTCQKRHSEQWVLPCRKGFTDDPAGRQCSFWSSDSVLGNRPVSPPALPISPDIASQEAAICRLIRVIRWVGDVTSI